MLVAVTQLRSSDLYVGEQINLQTTAEWFGAGAAETITNMELNGVLPAGAVDAQSPEGGAVGNGSWRWDISDRAGGTLQRNIPCVVTKQMPASFNMVLRSNTQRMHLDMPAPHLTHRRPVIPAVADRRKPRPTSSLM